MPRTPRLFSLLGTTYGGNGTSNFALPNLQGSAPLHQGQGIGLSPRPLGEVGGETSVTLLATEMAAHNHGITAQGGSGSQATPAGGFFAEARSGRALLKPYSSDTANTTMAAAAIGSVGGNLPHNNLQPYQVLTFIIALQGVFPARN